MKLLGKILRALDPCRTCRYRIDNGAALAIVRAERRAQALLADIEQRKTGITGTTATGRRVT